MIEWGVFVVLAICLLILTNRQKEETKEIFKNAKYVPGEITFFTGGHGTLIIPKVVNSPGQSARVKFKYEIEGKEYIKSERDIDSKIPKEGIKVGDRFVIAYHKDDPEKVRVMFDKPIKNETDFAKYLKELE